MSDKECHREEARKGDVAISRWNVSYIVQKMKWYQEIATGLRPSQ